MAVNSYDPTTGRPIFVDTDAPDIKVDPTQAAVYAADVGNRIIRADLVALDAYAYKREGLRGYALDSDIEYLCTGSGWSILLRPFSTYTTTVTGLTLGQVTVSAKYEQRGKLIKGEVFVTRDTAGSPTGSVTFTLPTTPANTSASRNIGAGSLYLQNNATVYTAHARYTGSNVITVNLPGITGSALAQGTNINATFPTSSPHGVGTVIYVPFEYETP